MSVDVGRFVRGKRNGHSGAVETVLLFTQPCVSGQKFSQLYTQVIIRFLFWLLIGDESVFV